MFVIDLVLFFLDTFLWYIIGTLSIPSHAPLYLVFQSGLLGGISTQLPKHIYARILATSDLEVWYKP